MQIPESPFQYTTTSSLNRVHRVTGQEMPMIDDLDLSFMDVLNTLSRTETSKSVIARVLKESAELQEAPQNAQEKKADSTSSASTTTPNSNILEIREQIDKDMVLLHQELQNSDSLYLKQAVIPGLPILIGSVPVQNIFPTDAKGQLSFQGHEISEKLAKLIEKGYKTGKPIRVDLDDKSSIVLKIKNGRVSAEFMSTDRTIALYMRQGLEELRSRLESKNLPVDTLEYRNPDKESRHGSSQQDDELS